MTTKTRFHLRTARPETLTDEQANLVLELAAGYLLQQIHGQDAMTTPDATREFLRLRLAAREHEVFSALWLDNRHRVIEFEEIFRGTIDGASVFPREVVKSAMHHNAAAVIFAHNHPSGPTDPSQADLRITQRLKDALALVEVRTLDHMIVSVEGTTSLAEQGLL